MPPSNLRKNVPNLLIRKNCANDWGQKRHNVNAPLITFDGAIKVFCYFINENTQIQLRKSGLFDVEMCVNILRDIAKWHKWCKKFAEFQYNNIVNDFLSKGLCAEQISMLRIKCICFYRFVDDLIGWLKGNCNYWFCSLLYGHERNKRENFDLKTIIENWNICGKAEWKIFITLSITDLKRSNSLKVFGQCNDSLWRNKDAIVVAGLFNHSANQRW